MARIEDKLKKVLLTVTVSCVGTVLLISASCLFFMRKTSLDTYEKMNVQSVETGRDILIDKISDQAEQYAVKCCEVIEKQFVQTTLSMGMIEGGLQDIYAQPETYSLREMEHASEVTGEGKQMHWLLPEDMEYQGETAEEIMLLGNILPYFKSLSDENAQILRLYFTSEFGVNVGYDEDYATKPSAFNGRERQWYQDAVNAGKITVSDVYQDSFRGQPVVTFSTPCYAKEGKLLGVLAVDLLIDDLEEMISEIDLEFGGYAMLMTRSGQRVAGESTVEKEADRDIDPYVIRSEIEGFEWDVEIVFDKAQFEQTARDSFSVLEVTMSQAGKAISDQMFTAVFLWGVCVCILVACVFHISRRMAEKLSRPVEQLTEEVRRIGTGALHYVSDIHTGDEIEELSHAFEMMTVSLKEHIGSLSRMSAEKERLATELNVATQIQVSMLPCIFPAFPDREEIDIFGATHPAREVGGDFYDFFLVDEKRLYIVIADVSGKGIPAALFMVVAKTLLKDNLSSGMPIEEAFSKVNRQLCENNEAGMFVTAFSGCLDLVTGEFRYVNAGHNPPLLLRADEKPSYIRAQSGFVLAGLPDTEYRAEKILLQDQDMVFAYTDGVTEAQDVNGVLFGEGRMEKFLEKAVGNAEEIVNSVSEEAGRFMRGAEQADDITMLALRFFSWGQKHVLKIKAEKEKLPVVKRFIDLQIAECLKQRDTASNETGISLKDNMRYWLQMAAEEIFINIASYAYKDLKAETQGSVEIWFRGKADRMKMTFIDKGIPYNPLEHPAPDISADTQDRTVGGLGIYIVRKSMDGAYYEYRNGKNVFTVWKYISS